MRNIPKVISGSIVAFLTSLPSCKNTVIFVGVSGVGAEAGAGLVAGTAVIKGGCGGSSVLAVVTIVVIGGAGETFLGSGKLLMPVSNLIFPAPATACSINVDVETPSSSSPSSASTASSPAVRLDVPAARDRRFGLELPRSDRSLVAPPESLEKLYVENRFEARLSRSLDLSAARERATAGDASTGVSRVGERAREGSSGGVSINMGRSTAGLSTREYRLILAGTGGGEVEGGGGVSTRSVMTAGREGGVETEVLGVPLSLSYPSGGPGDDNNEFPVVCCSNNRGENPPTKSEWSPLVTVLVEAVEPSFRRPFLLDDKLPASDPSLAPALERVDTLLPRSLCSEFSPLPCASEIWR